MVRLSRADWYARVWAVILALLGVLFAVLLRNEARGFELTAVGGIFFPGTVAFAIGGWGQHLTVTDRRFLIVTPFRRYDVRRADIVHARLTDNGRVAIHLTDGQEIEIQVGVAELALPAANRWKEQSRTLTFIRKNVLAEPAVTGGPATTRRWRKGVLSLAALALITVTTAFIYAEIAL